MSGPLSGVTVLDLTRVLSGPYCTMVLADLGARVIKVEHPGKGDDTRQWGPPFVGAESAYFLSINRNKESLPLDYKHPQGREVLERLIDRADVLVENFKPGTLDRAGFGWEAVHARVPGLVYASISGYGQTGPRRREPGYDAVIQAEGGLMSVTGDADGPAYRLGVAISDIVAGLFTAHGVLAALYARAGSGEGQRVDIGMLDTTAALLTYQAGNYFATGQVPGRRGNRHPRCAVSDLPHRRRRDRRRRRSGSIWRRFCPAIDRPTSPTTAIPDQQGPHGALTVEGRAERALAVRTRADWTERQGGRRALQAVRDVAGAVDPQLAARGMVVTLPHPASGRRASSYAHQAVGDVRCARAANVGNTDAILRELGPIGMIASLRPRSRLTMADVALIRKRVRGHRAGAPRRGGPPRVKGAALRRVPGPGPSRRSGRWPSS